MSVAFTFFFSPEITCHELSRDQGIMLQSRDRQLTFKQTTSGLRSALKTLQVGKGATKKELNDIVQQADGICGVFTFNSHLKKLMSLGWVCCAIDSWATAVPMT
ncbi:MAG: hypothetical protein RLZZ535_3812, partial [Cyanobacteriota bacterium]